MRLDVNRSVGRVLAAVMIAGAWLAARGAVALAQEPETSPPTELLDARAHYEEALAAATKPIRDRYLQELEQLKTTAYYTKNFDLAKSVTEEIASMTNTAADVNASPEQRVKAALINTTWVWWGGETITFLADGSARWSKTGAPAFTWNVAAAIPPVIEGKAPNGSKYRLSLDPGLRTGRLVEGTLPERPASQIGFK